MCISFIRVQYYVAVFHYIVTVILVLNGDSWIQFIEIKAPITLSLHVFPGTTNYN